MKKVLLLAYFLTFTFMAKASFTLDSTIVSDTTIVEFADSTVNKRITVMTNGTKTFEFPAELNLNSLLKELGVDSTDRENAIVIVKGNNDVRDTLFMLTTEGQKIQIITKKMIPRPRAVAIESDTIIDENQENEIHVYTPEPKEEKPKRFFPKSDFGFYIGLNPLAMGTPTPANNYNLRLWKSRYIALSFRKNMTLAQGDKIDLALGYGPEISWSNYMLENNNYITTDGSQTVFIPYAKNTIKSKFVIPSINFPVVIQIGSKEDKFKIGVGGFIGYRVGGYAKIKDSDRNKVKIKDDYNLSDFQYGLTAELGRKNRFTFFVRYHLNTLFNENQTDLNKIQPLSFGLRF